MKTTFSVSTRTVSTTSGGTFPLCHTTLVHAAAAHRGDGALFVGSETLMRKATNVGRAELMSLGTCFGKFTKTRKFKLHVTCLDYLAQYAKVRAPGRSAVSFWESRHSRRCAVPAVQGVGEARRRDVVLVRTPHHEGRSRPYHRGHAAVRIRSLWSNNSSRSAHGSSLLDIKAWSCTAWLMFPWVTFAHPY